MGEPGFGESTWWYGWKGQAWGGVSLVHKGYFGHRVSDAGRVGGDTEEAVAHESGAQKRLGSGT